MTRILFTRVNAIFAVTQSATECFHLEQSYTSSVTVGQMYNRIKSMGQLSERDKKWNALSLHLLLNEPVCHENFNIASDILKHPMARLIMMKMVLMTSSS